MDGAVRETPQVLAALDYTGSTSGWEGLSDGGGTPVLLATLAVLASGRVTRDVLRLNDLPCALRV